MVTLGSMPVDHEWLYLRREWTYAANTIAASVRISILDDLPLGKELDRPMLAAQATLKKRINSVWAEKARLTAKAAVIERHKRARANLFGRLKYIDTVGDVPMEDGTRRLVNLPEEWSTRLTDADVAALSKLAYSLDHPGAMALFRKVIDGRSNLPPLHAAALSALVATVEERFRHPEWGRNAEAVVQLHLDFRCVPKSLATSNRDAWTDVQRSLTQAMRTARLSGTAIVVPLLVAAPLARGAPKLIRAVVRKAPFGHLIVDGVDSDGSEIGSVCLEIGPRTVTVKGVVSKEPRVRPLAECTHLVGRDFGYRNTVALSVVRKDAPIDFNLLARASEWGRDETLAYLEGHVHDGEPVEEILLDGTDFLAAIAGHARRVDALRSEIDRTYLRILALKVNVNARIGAAPDALVDLGLDAGIDRHLAGWVKRLARLLAFVARLKVERRTVYRTVEGLKRSWFGHVSRIETDLARKWDAAVVREDLTVVAEEKSSFGYKGRTFNKMVNNGAKGQYIRRAAYRMRWNGIPELVVPSHWTSTTDVRHGVVDKGQRRGEWFVARVDGWRQDADLHAARTLALWPILRPRSDLLAQAA